MFFQHRQFTVEQSLRKAEIDPFPAALDFLTSHDRARTIIRRSDGSTCEIAFGLDAVKEYGDSLENIRDLVHIWNGYIDVGNAVPIGTCLFFSRCRFFQYRF